MKLSEDFPTNSDVDHEMLLSLINNEAQFDTLPMKIQLKCLKSTAFQLHSLLQAVATGQQDKAEKLLTNNPEMTQELLNSPGATTDYAGRTFVNCTAYEYAYWARDAHLCRMLEANMDEPTKALMLKRCEKIERDGLEYEQHGAKKNSTTFAFTPLINAYNTYLQAYEQWNVGENSEEDVIKAWVAVGVAQRDLPAHVIQEYCHPDRSFKPRPTFSVNENQLPRETKYYDFKTSKEVTLLPLTISDSEGLGVDFTLFRRGGPLRKYCGRGPLWGAAIDLEVISHLDAVRTDDIKQSLEILGKATPPVVSFGHPGTD